MNKEDRNKLLADLEPWDSRRAYAEIEDLKDEVALLKRELAIMTEERNWWMKKHQEDVRSMRHIARKEGAHEMQTKIRDLVWGIRLDEFLDSEIRSLEYKEDHKINCGWWKDWHACDCGAFNKENKCDQPVNSPNGYVSIEEACPHIPLQVSRLIFKEDGSVAVEDITPLEDLEK